MYVDSSANVQPTSIIKAQTSQDERIQDNHNAYTALQCWLSELHEVKNVSFSTILTKINVVVVLKNQIFIRHGSQYKRNWITLLSINLSNFLFCFKHHHHQLSVLLFYLRLPYINSLYKMYPKVTFTHFYMLVSTQKNYFFNIFFVFVSDIC